MRTIVTQTHLPSPVTSRTMPAMSESHTTVRFSQAYHEYKDAIYTFVLFRVGHNKDVAEDIVSDVFLKAYRRFDTYNKNYAMSTWLYAITRNTLIDYYRKEKQVVEIEEDQHADETDPLFRLLTEEISLREVTEAIEALPEQQRIAITEQFFNGKTAKEVAEEFNLSHAAVRQHVSRGVAALRNSLLSLFVYGSHLINTGI